MSICRGAPRVTNLLFADDSLLFCQATPKEGEVVAKILQTYERALVTILQLSSVTILQILRNNRCCRFWGSRRW